MHGDVRDIELGHPQMRGGRISVAIEPGTASKYFSQREIWVDYGDLDLHEVPVSTALLPALGTILPVAVAAGVGIRASEIDAAFATQAPQIAAQLQGMYPHLSQSPLKVQGQIIHRDKTPGNGRAALLYSGGVDSATSLLRHRDDVGCLISVWGADVELEDVELWHQLQAVIDHAPSLPGTRRLVARTNMRAVLDDLRLNREFDRGFVGTNWWGGIQHGIGLTMLIAPAAETLSLNRVMIASSHSADFQVPWGSDPDLDKLVAWSVGRVEHDSFELNRQQKIGKHIAPWLCDGNELPLAVCYQPNRGSTTNINCLHCEKCIRTASGLLVAGAAPAAAGVGVTDQTLRSWRERLDAGSVRLAANQIFHWTCIADAARQHLESTDEYVRWLANFDFSALAKSEQTPAGVGNMPEWRYQAERLAHRIPYGLRRRLREKLT